MQDTTPRKMFFTYRQNNSGGVWDGPEAVADPRRGRVHVKRMPSHNCTVFTLTVWTLARIALAVETVGTAHGMGMKTHSTKWIPPP